MRNQLLAGFFERCLRDRASDASSPDDAAINDLMARLMTVEVGPLVVSTGDDPSNR